MQREQLSPKLSEKYKKKTTNFNIVSLKAHKKCDSVTVCITSGQLPK